jgi:hypothetical protein
MYFVWAQTAWMVCGCARNGSGKTEHASQHCRANGVHSDLPAPSSRLADLVLGQTLIMPGPVVDGGAKIGRRRGGRPFSGHHSSLSASRPAPAPRLVACQQFDRLDCPGGWRECGPDRLVSLAGKLNPPNRSLRCGTSLVQVSHFLSAFFLRLRHAFECRLFRILGVLAGLPDSSGGSADKFQ